MSTETNSYLSPLSDEELLKEILSELDKIKESDPVRFQKNLQSLCEIHINSKPKKK